MRNWTNLNPLEQAALAGVGGERGVFVRPSFVKALGGDGNTAILLTQMLFWSRSDTAEKNEGWFYRTAKDILADTGLSTGSQERVRRKLIMRGILEEARRGVPARLYFRINLDGVLNLFRGQLPNQFGGQPLNWIGGQPPNIVNREVDEGVNEDVPSDTTYPQGAAAPRPRDAKVKIHVLGERFPAYVDWIVAQYPLNAAGLGATKEQAERIAHKLGDILSTDNDEKRAEADAKVKELSLGIKNLRDAVNNGSYDRQYVPKFQNFSGLGIMYGKDPAYKEWAARRQPAPKKKEFVA